MDQEIRNKLRNVVTQCRKLLEDAITQELEGKYSIFAKKDQVTADPKAEMKNLTSPEDREARKDILDHYAHIKARGFKPKDALDQLIREIAFTHLNRLCAYKMMEAREVYVGGQKFREAVSRGVNSNGVKFYLAEHPDEERLFNTGHQDVAYRHFLDWLGGALSDEIGVLFNPNDPANRLYPRQKTLDEVLDLLNDGGIKAEETELREQWPLIWSQDETIGWVYQYFTPKELRDQARKESQAPRNSYELAFRNQFFTPRYVVEFLTDNTLGRIWYEMRKGNTRLKDECRYMVRRPDEVFLAPSTSAGHEHFEQACGDCVRMLLEADESSFPLFHADDEDAVQRMIALAHCVSAYDQFGEGVWEWFERMQPLVEGGRGSIAEISTGDLLNYLFLTCRGDRHSGDGAVYREEWFVNAANEIRRRALLSRTEDASQEQLLNAPVFIPHRPKKDPRELKTLDPACGSGHFLLYCFDLLLPIYEEAYADPDLGPALKKDYPTLDALKRDVPRLILAHNLHGIDIDLRASQIAALALWLRCQRSYQDMGLKKDRPQITRSNFVCAEPMPGEEQMLKEFVGQLEPKVLGQVVEVVFDKMKLAGEAGSLLKIEEEIRDAIREAKRQYAIGGIQIQQTLFDEPSEPVAKVFSVKDITDAQFFEGAEAQVVEALRSYAEKAQNGQRLQRQLFSEDAVRGFAFVDLCQKRYDVVLMNPPFGRATDLAFELFRTTFPASYIDIYCCFVERALQLSPTGSIGALTSRSYLNAVTLEEFRQQVTPRISALLDLGLGVLDNALVEVAASIFVPTNPAFIAIFDVQAIEERDEATLLRVSQYTQGQLSHDCHIVNKAALASVPKQQLLYKFTDFGKNAEATTFEPGAATVRTGLNTFDNFRFLRCWWEVEPTHVGRGKHWEFFSKGGEFETFYDDIHLVINRANDGEELAVVNRLHNGQTAQSRQSHKHYYIPGLIYTIRSSRGFNVRHFPAGCVFSIKGPVIQATNDASLAFIASFLNSEPIRGFIQQQANANQYMPSLVKLLPWKKPDPDLHAEISALGSSCIAGKRSYYVQCEEGVSFVLPPGLDGAPSSIKEIAIAQSKGVENVNAMLRDASCKASERLSEFFAFPKVNWEAEGVRLSDHHLSLAAEIISAQSIAVRVLSYALGCALGRWDVRLATKDLQVPQLPGPFDVLPICPPGTLAGFDGLPAKESPPGYRLRINWDGILVDDPDHLDDIVGRCHDGLELAFGDRLDAIEDEVCAILGARQLRDYFRKPTNGGFWDDHISRYSKSRRKAPIYWLLQSSKKNYALWLYYHRLDKDLLFKALVNYVEPKIRLETSRLESLRSQKAAAGDSGKEAKRLAKEVEKQEDFLSELRDFEDKLRRAANLHLEPDLNDGVVLNIAPLHELVPWKEAKKYWNELMEGKYEWSSIGKQLREKGLVK